MAVSKRNQNINPLLTEIDTTSSVGTTRLISLHKCINYICLIVLCPLNILTYPLIYLLDGLSCWKTKKYQQHDLSLQFAGICQNLVALFWSNSLVGMIEYILNEQSLNLKDTNLTLMITVSYAFIMYLLSILLILMVSKLKFLSDRISFFLGLFVRIIAFGVKDLGFEIQDIYFANSFKSTLAFFFIQLFVAIMFLISLSTFRSKLCPNRFTVNEKEQSKHNKRNNKKRNRNKYDTVHQKRMAKKQRHQDLEEKRLLCKKREMNFNHLINRLDTDIWTISLGFCLVEVVICGLSGKWIPLESSVIHDESINDIDAMYFLYLFGSLCIIWIIWLQCIAFFQMIRDRAYQKVFLMANYVQIGQSNINQYYDDYIIQFTNVLHKKGKLSQNNKNTTDNKSIISCSYNNNSISKDKRNNMSYLLFPKRISPKKNNQTTKTNGSDSDSNIISNASGYNYEYNNLNETSSSSGHFEQLPFWYRFLFQSGFKYKNATDRFVVFMDGILGWSIGWSMAGAIFISHHHEYRLIYALFATIACILMETCRTFYIHKNINKWYEISKKRRRLYKQTVDDIEHKQHLIDVSYYQDTTDFDAEFQKRKQILFEEQKKLDIKKKEIVIAAATTVANILPEDTEISPKYRDNNSFAIAKHRSTMDESDCASSINFGMKKNNVNNGSGFNFIEYIRRKTSSIPRKESVATYLSSNLDISDPRKRHINLGIMSNTEHKAVYIYNHISVTCRKAIGLVLAIVWSAAIVSVLDHKFNQHIAFKYDLYLMIGITVFATYLGMRITEIKTKYVGYSNADITKRFIQAYHEDVLETRQNIATKFQLD